MVRGALLLMVLSSAMVVQVINPVFALADTQWPKLVSVSAEGQPGDLSSADTSFRAIQVSNDGRYVAFLSQATNLTGSGAGVYVRDLQTNTTVVGSIGTGGNVVSPSQADFALSGNGRYLAFNNNGGIDIRDLQSGTTRHVNTTGDPTRPTLSDDGSIMATTFRIFQTNYIEVQNVTNGVVVGSDVGTDGNTPLVSGDGRYVVYTSDCCSNQVRLMDVATGQHTTLSSMADGTPGNGSSQAISISGNGRYVLFYTLATNLSPSGETGGYRKDVQTGEVLPFPDLPIGGITTALTRDGDTAVYNGDCHTPGSVVFSATCLYHFSTGQYQAVSRNQWGAVSEAGGGSNPAISGDGSMVAFSTWSNDQYGVSSTAMQIYAEPTVSFSTVPDGTAPTLGPVTLTPDSISPGSGSGAVLSASVSDTISGVRRVEYFIGADPGQGKGASLYVSDGVASATLYNCNSSGDPSPQFAQVMRLAVGPSEACIINVRAVDNAGNWSQIAQVALHMVSPDTNPPTLGTFNWTANPKVVNQTSALTVPVTDDVSGVAAGEYFVDTDPGVGNATPMDYDGSQLSAGFASNGLTAGVYQIGVRARDDAGNWSEPSYDYLVVTDTTLTQEFDGKNKKDLVPNIAYGDVLPGLMSAGQTDVVNYGFTVSYANGVINPRSDFAMSYMTGTKCGKVGAQNCHSFDMSATSIAWLLLDQANSSRGRFQGMATVKVDGVTTINPFTVQGVDGDRLTPNADDFLIVKVFAPGANPNTAMPLYQASGNMAKGNSVRVK